MTNVAPGFNAREFFRLLLEPTPVDRDASWRASQAAIGECMGRAGFSYRPVPLPSSDMPIEDIVSPTTRRRFGYGIRRSYESSLQETEDPNRNYLASLDVDALSAYRHQLLQCSTRAAESLGLPAHMADTIGVDLLARRLRQMSEAFWQGKQVKALVGRYRECMHRKGFDVEHYSTSAELVAYDLGQLLQDPAYREQILHDEARVAALDADCMDLVYQPLRRLWSTHAHDSLADLADLLDLAMGKQT